MQLNLVTIEKVLICSIQIIYSAFQIDELYRHNQNLVGTLHKGVPTVVYRHENCCNDCCNGILDTSGNQALLIVFLARVINTFCSSALLGFFWLALNS